MSMIDAFFKVKYKENRWFDGLEVMNCGKCREIMNSYPVISISMKDLDTDDSSEFIKDFSLKIGEVCLNYKYVLEGKAEPELKKKIPGTSFRDV